LLLLLLIGFPRTFLVHGKKGFPRAFLVHVLLFHGRGGCGGYGGTADAGRRNHKTEHSGVQTSARRVKVSVPGKFFPQLQPAEQKAFYEGEAVEYRERYKLIFMFFYREN
jgi:hypothetical protein